MSCTSSFQKGELLIEKEMTIGQVIRKHPETIPVFLRNGLTCIGCPMASMETVEQGALSHGIDAEEFVKELNASAGKRIKRKKK